MKIRYSVVFILAMVFELIAKCGYSQSQVEQAKHFERDMKVGYLLNYFFMLPKPYCWVKKEVYLSAWEVDRSGGTFSFSPAGIEVIISLTAVFSFFIITLHSSGEI